MNPESRQSVIQPAPFSEARYAEAFNFLVKVSREYEPMKRALVRVINKHCPGPYSLLDIGAGRGIFFHDVLSELYRQPCRYGAYEPNANHFQELQTRAEALGEQQELRQQSFTPESELKPVWDVVLMSHCLYWMQPMGKYVRAAMAGLKPDGVLVIFLQPAAGFYLIQNDFSELMSIREDGLNTHSSTLELMPELSELNIEAVEELLPGYLDFSGIWNDDEALLEMGCFILGGELRGLPESIQKSMLHHIRANTLQLDQFKLFNQPTSMVLVYK
ncbi:class I SAM-dependent methyltransferase [Endozoicomonas gorgoniicola]|uniref:Class I SAM-dependent methyltransferase n=1 Tax=Endozoicomonas gorgoniicola TaxID=1234144 RepID=A0ABT3N3A4_9GAMM|nr:class I SAM-dependent methyltransferase [Endozoicomonas gorgoniicola]MCW7556112.1 class I SAM-dependent methyltransferase [Endozoicomonas gorgoniicola]